LRDALRAGWTDRVGSKAAFLPDQPCQECDRQTLSSGRRFDKTADGCFVCRLAPAGLPHARI
jgi:hypothetical protein